MSKNIKEFLSKFIDSSNVELNGIKKEELISLSLYFVYKKKYFNKMFDSMYIRTNYNDEMRLVTPTHNNVKGVSNSTISKLVCAPLNDERKEQEEAYFFERPSFDEYFFEDMSDEEIDNWVEPTLKDDKIYLDDRTIKNILSFHKIIKSSKNSSDLKNEIESLHMKNPDAVFDFYSHLNTVVSHDNPIFDYLNNHLKLEKLESKKHHYKLPYMKKKGISFFKFGSNADFNFEEAKEGYLKKFKKEISNIKRLQNIVDKHKKSLSKIINKVNDYYPELNESISKEDVKNLDFYAFEAKAAEQTEFVRTATLNPVHDLSMFKKHDLNKTSFYDFVFENPFDINSQNSNSNAYQGMVYVSKEIYSKKIYSTKETTDYVYIVAKTKHNETAGVICLSKKDDVKNVYKINEISIKNNFRNKGLATEIYSKVADFCIKNDLILSNNTYSHEGDKYLPKMVQKLREEKPDFMSIDSNLSNIYDNNDKTMVVEYYNKNILNFLSQNKDFNYKTFKESYRKGYTEIVDRDDQDSYERDDANFAFKTFSDNYETQMKKQTKKRNRFIK